MNEHQLAPDWSKSVNVKCKKCGGTYFTEVYMLKKFSKLLIGTSEDKIVPVSVLRCTNPECAEIMEELLPLELRTKQKTNIEIKK